jgi:ABC-type polysaccharide/polyol phosphate export permease
VTSSGTTRPPLLELTLVRLREFVREPEAVFWVFVFPILMTCALGLAFRSRGEPPALIGIEDGPGRPALQTALAHAGHITVRVLPPGDVAHALARSDVQLVVDPGPPVIYRFDPTRAESRLARRIVDDALQRAAGRVDPVHATDAPVEVAGSRYVDWLVPGLLGMNIMSTGLWGIGFSVVTARTRKLLKRLVASPMRRRDYLLGHLFGRLVFLVIEVAVLVSFSRLVFGVPMRGSWLLLAATCLVGGLSFGGLGLLVASRARTVEAVSGLLNLVMLPMWLLSGVFFASSNFPDAMQPAIQVLPLTALNEALRAVMLEGAGWGLVLHWWGILGAWGIVTFPLALWLFRWR